MLVELVKILLYQALHKQDRASYLKVYIFSLERTQPEKTKTEPVTYHILV
ncbi:hypothetical protein Hanom_Chr08g00733561 [Helianthus anomalus]